MQYVKESAVGMHERVVDYFDSLRLQAEAEQRASNMMTADSSLLQRSNNIMSLEERTENKTITPDPSESIMHLTRQDYSTLEVFIQPAFIRGNTGYYH